MTEHQLRTLMHTWAQRLGLGHWHLTLVVGGDMGASSYMEVHESSNYERAVIHVQPWLLGQGKAPENVLVREPDPEFVEQSLVHELLHLHTRELRQVLREDLDGLVHRDVGSLLNGKAHDADERCVDRLATALTRAWRTEVAASW